MNATRVLDTSACLLTVPLLPTAGVLDFCVGLLAAAFTFTPGGLLIVPAPNPLPAALLSEDLPLWHNSRWERCFAFLYSFPTPAAITAPSKKAIVAAEAQGAARRGDETPD